MSGRWLSTGGRPAAHVCDVPDPVVAGRVGAAWQCECRRVWLAVGGHPAPVCSWLLVTDRRQLRRLLRGHPRRWWVHDPDDLASRWPDVVVSAEAPTSVPQPPSSAHANCPPECQARRWDVWCTEHGSAS